MADRIQTFEIVTATGTTKAAPQVDDTSFLPGTIERIEILIPDGPRGLSGFSIGQGKNQIWPRTTGTYMVGNGEVIRLDNPEALNTGNFQFYSYNTGGYVHHYFLRFYVNELGKGAAALKAAQSSTPLSAQAIESPPAGALGAPPPFSLEPPPELAAGEPGGFQPPPGASGGALALSPAGVSSPIPEPVLVVGPTLLPATPPDYCSTIEAVKKQVTLAKPYLLPPGSGSALIPAEALPPLSIDNYGHYAACQRPGSWKYDLQFDRPASGFIRNGDSPYVIDFQTQGGENKATVSDATPVVRYQESGLSLAVYVNPGTGDPPTLLAASGTLEIPGGTQPATVAA